MKKKVGVVSCYFKHNYGSMLQAYATQAILDNMGIDNETIKKEVMDLHSAVYDKFLYEMKYIRPPKGEFSERTLDYTNSLGYKTVMWSLAYDDWDESKQGREVYGKNKVLDNVHNGAIILLHSNSKDNSNILNDVIKEIRNMGYEFDTLDNFEN